VKGISPIVATVIFTAIILLSIGLVLYILIPYMEKSKDVVALNKGQRAVNSLARALSEILEEGKYASRVVTVDISRGKIVFNPVPARIEYVLESKWPIVARDVSIKRGYVTLSTGSDVSVIDNGDVITLKNSFLEVNVTKKGSFKEHVEINLSEIISGVKLVKEGVVLKNKVEINVGGIEKDTGYIYAPYYGTSLPKGVVKVVLDSGIEITIELRSMADYLVLDVKKIA